MEQSKWAGRLWTWQFLIKTISFDSKSSYNNNHNGKQMKLSFLLLFEVTLLLVLF